VRTVTANIDRQLTLITSKRTASLKLILFVIEYVLPRSSWWPFRSPFSKLKPAARKQLIEKHLKNAHSTGLLRDLARIRTLFALGYYGDPRTHSSVGFVPVPDRPKYQPDKLHRLGLPPISVETPTTGTLDTDVCVIGSGAGGAVVAAAAAEQGMRVILLEEGQHVSAQMVTHDEGAMTALLYKEGGLQSTVDLDMTVLQGRSLGQTRSPLGTLLAPESIRRIWRPPTTASRRRSAWTTYSRYRTRVFPPSMARTRRLFFEAGRR